MVFWNISCVTDEKATIPIFVAAPEYVTPVSRGSECK